MIVDLSFTSARKDLIMQTSFNASTTRALHWFQSPNACSSLSVEQFLMWLPGQRYSKVGMFNKHFFILLFLKVCLKIHVMLHFIRGSSVDKISGLEIVQ